MTENGHDKEFKAIAGAFGPVESVPLLGDLIGNNLLDVLVTGYSYWKLGCPSGIFQNDGTVFPLAGRASLLNEFCESIRSTEKGQMCCISSDCQAVGRFAGGDRLGPDARMEEATGAFPIEPVSEFTLERGKVHCYKCYAGLLELVRPICLDFGDGLPTPVGAIWAGQNKVEGYCSSDADVYKIATVIDYPDPEKLVELYNQICFTTQRILKERSESLAETAQSLENSASALFHNRKQMQYDQIFVAILKDLRTSLSKVKISTANIQEQIYASMRSLLKQMTDNIANCYSAFCEIPPNLGEAKDPKIRIVAHAGLHKRKLDKGFTITVPYAEIEEIWNTLGSTDHPRVFSLSTVDWKLLTKLRSAAKVDNVDFAIVSRLEHPHNRALWVTLLCDNSEVLTPIGNLLPEFLRMLHNILENANQIMLLTYLFVQQQDTVRTLEKQRTQLERKDVQSRLLLQNIAHHVSRPIMELKQSAYILSRGFSREAYDGFRASLTELERGCRNFTVYEELTTGIEKKEYSLYTRCSFDITQVVWSARERVAPFLRAERRELQISEKTAKGHSIPHVIGNPEATLVCLVNVFHNAIKYSIGSRPVEVEISQQERSTVHVRVSNYGIAVPESEAEAVFQESYRADTAKAVAIEGSGLGLYVSRKLIEVHDGSIAVESCVPAQPTNDGIPRWKTTFVISLKC
jgi:signal transduction histidine kinase/ligand-binding sensor protein